LLIDYIATLDDLKIVKIYVCNIDKIHLFVMQKSVGNKKSIPTIRYSYAAMAKI